MTSRAARLLPLLITAAVPACAEPVTVHQAWMNRGSQVSVSVEVEGSSAPLYAAPDGSGRYYVEARRGARYSLRLSNRTGERLAVLMTVDGLNVISGDKQPAGETGRMYVLDPWESALIQGWRTSLDDVRRFTFVDEQASYATRAGKANSRMGWIEMAVFHERQRYAYRREPDVAQPQEESRDDQPAAPSASADARGRSENEGAAKAGSAAAAQAPRAYPGTGWGERTHDTVQLVDFEAESQPSERITLRYEYASGLRALGILPWRYTRDRLQQRDSGDGGGFAQPPRW